VRYKIDQTPGMPVAETSPDILLFTIVLSLFIGIGLLVIGKRGGQLWLTVWSAGLILCSVAYLVWHWRQ